MLNVRAKVRYLDASALVKLVVDEGDHQPIRNYFYANVNFFATSLCLGEALGVLKAKLNYKKITDEQYFLSTRQLVIDAWGKRIEIAKLNLFSPAGLTAVEELAKKHSLDLSDALQLETILRGDHSHMVLDSAPILVTADAKLATAAREENICTWNCIVDPLPEWA